MTKTNIEDLRMTAADNGFKINYYERLKSGSQPMDQCYQSKSHDEVFTFEEKDKCLARFLELAGYDAEVEKEEKNTIPPLKS